MQVFKILLFILYFLCKTLFALLRILQFLGKSVREKVPINWMLLWNTWFSELYLLYFMKNYLDARPLTWMSFHVILILFSHFNPCVKIRIWSKVSLFKFYGMAAWNPHLNPCICKKKKNPGHNQTKVSYCFLCSNSHSNLANLCRWGSVFVVSCQH